ncbi:hypothetical protein THASP1DRAFT_17053 [Thamnocephalis sphaerospora]|uniref:Fe2OG dioxygenase domain-containing protein n=1 Tax=Thamnocephalis sphaerospora TaxID=78915 RepID=A0A4P9XNB6_9FUNG|nr:hypothetical protein THASP1DRAFT_17053 [Thamnocephalis sphaerospora]|eukprot:RKP07434.1 hypothetical protein THASP1DRAFT_17053 [Thamnocephalis sphaerospora]
MALFVPIIDFGPYLDPAADEAQRRAVIDALDSACRNVGFFFLANHGIPQALFDQIRAIGHRFFDKPAEEKLKYTTDSGFRGYKRFSATTTNGQGLHEVIAFYASANSYTNGRAPAAAKDTSVPISPDAPDVFGEQNMWPDGEFRAVAEEYLGCVQRLSQRVLSALATALGVGDSFHDWMDDPFWGMRVTGYPGIAETGGKVGDGVNFKEHTDFGCITLINQDDGPDSLQVCDKQGQWHSVTPVPNALVVNIGDLFSIWTCGRYPAPLHRVVHRAAHRRVSVPIFIDPRFDAVTGPLPELQSADDAAPKYEARPYGDYLWDRISEFYPQQSEGMQRHHA